MIDFKETWIPAILEYANLVVDEATLKTSWISGDTSETSIYYPGELIEQVFGDLDSWSMLGEWNVHFPHLQALKGAVEGFLHSLEQFDKWAESVFDMTHWGRSSPSATDAAKLFSSDEWHVLRESAAKVVNLSNELRCELR